MWSEWSSMRLGDLVTLQRGYDLPASAQRHGSVPVIGSGGPNGSHDEARAKGPGVTVGRSGVGSMGEPYYVTADYWPHNTVLFCREFYSAEPRFVYYLFCTIDFRRLNSGSAQASLNRNAAHQLWVTVPCLAEQQAIAEVLGALDDKIALNRQMNRTLQEMASALFRSWFIDYDPVVAKAAGRVPFEMEAETAALFPDAFIESEEGPIPAGWTLSSLSEVVDGIRDSVDPSEVHPTMPYIGLEHMTPRCINLDTWGDATAVSSNKSRFREGDILFGKLRPYFGKVGVAHVDGICSTDIIVLRARRDSFQPWALGHLASESVIAFASATASGTRMPRTSWSIISQYRVVQPPSAVARAHANIVSNWLAHLKVTGAQSRALTTLRDALLPQLLSGTIRLKDAERAVGEA